MYQGQDGTNGFGSFGNPGFSSPQSVMGNGSSGNMQPFPQTGDIILSGNTTKKKKKWIIVVIIVLLVLAVIGGVVVAVFGLRGNKNSSALTKDSCIHLIMYGDEKIDSENTENYADFEQIYYNSESEEWDNYYTKVMQCLENSLSELDSKKAVDEIAVRVRRESAKKLIETLKVISFDKSIEDRVEYLSALYLDNKQYDAQGVLDKTLKEFDESVGGVDVESYKNEMKNLLSNVEKNLRYYELYGCQGDSYQDFTCDTADFSIDLNEKYGIDDVKFAEYIGTEQNLDDAVYSMVLDFGESASGVLDNTGIVE